MQALQKELLLQGFIAKARTGKIFTVTFRKKDGTVRACNARLGVTKGLTGKGLAWKPTTRGMIPVYDMQKREYRMVNFNTLLSIKMEGKTYLQW
jgi:hypothetical protein